MRLRTIAALAGAIALLATADAAPAASVMQAGPVFADPGDFVDCVWTCPGTADSTVQVKVVDGSGVAVADTGPQTCPAGYSGYTFAAGPGTLHCEVLGLSAKKATGTLVHFRSGTPIATIPMH